MWDEITYPFPNFIGCTVEVWEWISNFISTLYNGCDYLSMLGLKLIRVSKRGPRSMDVETHQSWLAPSWKVNSFFSGGTIRHYWYLSPLAMMTARCLFSARPLSKPVLTLPQWKPENQSPLYFQWKFWLIGSIRCFKIFIQMLAITFHRGEWVDDLFILFSFLMREVFAM